MTKVLVTESQKITDKRGYRKYQVEVIQNFQPNFELKLFELGVNTCCTRISQKLNGDAVVSSLRPSHKSADRGVEHKISVLQD